MIIKVWILVAQLNRKRHIQLTFSVDKEMEHRAKIGANNGKKWQDKINAFLANVLIYFSAF